MANSITDPYFLLIRRFLKILCLWPNGSDKPLARYVAITNLLVLISITIALQVPFILFDPVDELQKSKTFGVMGFYVYVTVKYIHWLFNMSAYRELILQLQRSSFQDLCKEDHHLVIIEETRKRARRLLYGHVSLPCLVIVLGFFIPLLANTVLKDVPVLGKTFPYETYHVLNISDTTNFVIEASVHGFYTLAAGIVAFGSETCLIGILMLLTAQTKVIGSVLENINIDKSVVDEETYASFYRCVDEINVISTMMKKLSRTSSGIIFCQYSVFTMCFCNLINCIPKENDRPRLVLIAGMILFIAFQLFLIAWFNQSFDEQFGHLAFCVYNMNWLKSDPGFRKMLVFSMARLQKSSSIEISGLGSVNLTLFVKVMRITYSFYMLVSNYTRKEDGGLVIL